MITFVAVLLCICTCIVICMWLCIDGQITNMYKRVDDIKRVVDLIFHNMPSDTTVGNYYIWLKDYIGTVNDHLTTEIACLATKNNEDIKRLKGNYTVGDLLRFEDTRWCVFCEDILDDGRTRWKLFGENGDEYSIYTDAIPVDIEFLGHKDLSFD